MLLLLPIGLQILFWSIHGLARVLERVNAFKVRANYLKFLLQGIMTLPMDWHASHTRPRPPSFVQSIAGSVASIRFPTAHRDRPR